MKVLRETRYSGRNSKQLPSKYKPEKLYRVIYLQIYSLFFLIFLHCLFFDAVFYL